MGNPGGGGGTGGGGVVCAKTDATGIRQIINEAIILYIRNLILIGCVNVLKKARY